jgi:hypothetical protein
MTPDELVAKVAREIYASGPDVTKDEAFRAALAALRVVREAMGEPDEAMLQNSQEATTAWGRWRLMLAASPLGRIDA